MQKTAKKRSAARPATPSSKRPKSRRKSAKGNQVAVQSSTKQSATVEMLRSPGGATIEALTKATGWQPHSVRSFFAGVVRKRLKLDLQSSVVGGVRVYRITGRDGAKPVAPKSDRS